MFRAYTSTKWSRLDVYIIPYGMLHIYYKIEGDTDENKNLLWTSNILHSETPIFKSEVLRLCRNTSLHLLLARTHIRDTFFIVLLLTFFKYPHQSLFSLTFEDHFEESR